MQTKPSASEKLPVWFEAVVKTDQNCIGDNFTSMHLHKHAPAPYRVQVHACEADAASWPDVQLKFKLVKYSFILLIMDFQG